MSRFDSDEHGTVVEIDGHVKIKWDDGAISIFKHGKPGNVQFVSKERPRRPPKT